MNQHRFALRMPNGALMKFFYNGVSNVVMFGENDKVAKLIDYIIERNSDVILGKDNIIVCDFSGNISSDKARVVRGAEECSRAFQEFAIDMRADYDKLLMDKCQAIEYYNGFDKTMKYKLIILHGFEDMIKQSSTEQMNRVTSGLSSIRAVGSQTGKHLILTARSADCCEKEVLSACTGRLTINDDVARYCETYFNDTVFKVNI